MRDQDRIAKFREKLAAAIAYEGLTATDDFRLGEFNCLNEYNDITFDDLVTLTTAVDEQQADLLALVQQWRETGVLKNRAGSSTLQQIEGDAILHCADQLERRITGEGK